MQWLQRVLGELAAPIASFFTMLGEELILILILGFLYWCYDKEFGCFIGTNLVAGLCWNPMLKNVVLRRRPYFDNAVIKCLKVVNAEGDMFDTAVQGFSFPSGHSMNSAIVYGSFPMYLKKRPAVIVAILVPLLVGVSRFILGVHYPTDVLVGWAMGLITLLVLSKIQEKIQNRWKLNLVIFLLSVPGVFYCRTMDYFTALGVMAGFFLAQEFEKRFVNFEMTRNPAYIVCRMLGGFIGYFGLNFILKMPFNKEFLQADTTGSFLIRTLRYMIVTFVILGVYPIVFRLVEKNPERRSVC